MIALPITANVRSGIRFRGRYWRQSGHELLRCTCPLVTQSGHSAIVGPYVKLSIVVTAHGAT